MYSDMLVGIHVPNMVLTRCWSLVPIFISSHWKNMLNMHWSMLLAAQRHGLLQFMRAVLSFYFIYTYLFE